MNIKVKFKPLKNGAKLPYKATKGSSCYDVYAPEDVVLRAGSTQVVGLGFAVQFEEGFEIQIRGRSGLSKDGIITHLGTIDSDYRGEVGIIVTNLNDNDRAILAGERIGQLKIAPSYHIQWEETKELNQTERKGGFGSTGK